MSDIDFSKIKVGDKVRLRARLLESVDWMAVTDIYEAGTGSQRLEVEGGWYVWAHDRSYVEIIAHQPAPRNVEVTLGKPLTGDYRGYPQTMGNRVFASALTGEEEIVFKVNDATAYYTFAVARHVALDLLATVGIDE